MKNLEFFFSSSDHSIKDKFCVLIKLIHVIILDKLLLEI